MKQALVEQGKYRQQEKSRLGWPDHTAIDRKVTNMLDTKRTVSIITLNVNDLNTN